MKKLLLLSIVNASCSIFAMRNYTEAQVTDKLSNYTYTQGQSLYTGNNILHTASFSLKNDQKNPCLFLEIRYNKKEFRTDTKANVYFDRKYVENAKLHDTIDSNEFKVLVSDIELFKEKYLTHVKMFFDQLLKEDSLNNKRRMEMIVSVLDESPEIAFPNAYNSISSKYLYKAFKEMSLDNNVNQKATEKNQKLIKKNQEPKPIEKNAVILLYELAKENKKKQMWHF